METDAFVRPAERSEALHDYLKTAPRPCINLKTDQVPDTPPTPGPTPQPRGPTIIAAGLLLAALALVVLYTSRRAFLSPVAMVVVAAIGLPPSYCNAASAPTFVPIFIQTSAPTPAPRRNLVAASPVPRPTPPERRRRSLRHSRSLRRRPPPEPSPDADHRPRRRNLLRPQRRNRPKRPPQTPPLTPSRLRHPEAPRFHQRGEGSRAHHDRRQEARSPRPDSDPRSPKAFPQPKPHPL